MLSHVSNDWPVAHRQTKTCRTLCAPWRWRGEPLAVGYQSQNLITSKAIWSLSEA
jgi:hypothetical protein